MQNQGIALITGANRGLGKQAAMEIADLGWEVVVGTRDAAAGQEIVDTILSLGKSASHITIDISDQDSIRKAAEQLASRIDHIDALLNNAGILLDEEESILETTPDKLLESFRINAVGPALVAAAFTPLLSKADSPRIVNVSSGAGQLCDMESWAPAYSISKTALNAVTRQLASTLRSDSISVNCVCPGWCRTDMGGPQATRSPEEGVNTIVWLATEAPHDWTGMFFRDRAEIPW